MNNTGAIENYVNKVQCGNEVRGIVGQLRPIEVELTRPSDGGNETWSGKITKNAKEYIFWAKESLGILPKILIKRPVDVGEGYVTGEEFMDITFVYNSGEVQYLIFGFAQVETKPDSIVLSTFYGEGKERLFFYEQSEEPTAILSDDLPYIPFPGYVPPTTD